MRMPFLFLSPSTQYFNLYVNEENERYWMNNIADAMTPYLLSSGVNVTRNDPNGSVTTSIRQSNLGSYGFHLALHSNAAPESMTGHLRGIDAYYYPTSTEGLRMAEIIVDNLKPVYPLPERVQALPSSDIAELRRTVAPACLVELGYHDNPDDAAWIVSHIEPIAQSLALSVTEYFGLPFLTPSATYPAIVSETAALFGGPEPSFPVIATIAADTLVTVYNEYNGWYVVSSNGLMGYMQAQYVTLQ